MDHNLSERSKREYAARMREIQRKMGANITTLTPQLLVEHISAEADSQQVAPSTFRQHKAAAIYWLAQQAQALIAAGQELADHAHAFDAIRAVRPDAKRGPMGRTSSEKLKYFRSDCADALQAYISNTGGLKSAIAARTMAFVRANLLVGLRPAEWFDSRLASYVGQDNLYERHGLPAKARLQFVPMLIVENAKATHGRGNGAQRELLLHGITAPDLKAIVLFHQLATEFKRLHPEITDAKRLGNMFYRPINNFIRRGLLSSGYSSKDIPSAYSTRHQVVADAKASGLAARDTAAFFGHSSVYTSKEHYGLKRHGQRAFTFRASPESLSLVADPRPQAHATALPAQLADTVDRWAQEHDARRSR